MGSCDFFYCCDTAVATERLHGVELRACPRHRDALAELMERSESSDLFVLASAFIPRLSREKRLDLIGASRPPGGPQRALVGV